MLLTIPLNGIPTIDRAGSFPLLNPVFEFSYRNPTHVIHLYDYVGRVRIDSKEYPVFPGDITCIQSGSVYSFFSTSPGKHWCIHFLNAPTTQSPGMELPPHIHPGLNGLFFLEQVRLICRLFNSNVSNERVEFLNTEAQVRLQALLLSLHNYTTGNQQKRRGGKPFSWEHIMTWLDDNLNQPVSTETLAEKADVSPSTFSRKFKENYGTTLKLYLLRKRVEKAKSLLATTTLTICEVGDAVGISDPQYFNKQFRKVAGTSPSGYRNENQEYLHIKPSEIAIRDGHWDSAPETRE